MINAQCHARSKPCNRVLRADHSLLFSAFDIHFYEIYSVQLKFCHDLVDGGHRHLNELRIIDCRTKLSLAELAGLMLNFRMSSLSP